ncbi:hypothetical protein QE152_g33751 [Popillia japonica]|uniref:Uncharacterized protein n=1 Tax=Popillia japonica TaxID=7064 RepID=A0AAW1IVJ5_POPJA
MYSEESTDENNKRRRVYEEDEDTPFGGSRKTQRTPTKTNKNREDKMDKLMNMMIELNAEIKNMNTEMKEMRKDQKEYREEIKILKEQNEILKEKYKETEKENEQIKKELHNIKKNIEWMEKEKNEKNVVVTGLSLIEKTEPYKLKEEMDKFLAQQLQVQAEIETARKIGIDMYYKIKEN